MTRGKLIDLEIRMIPHWKEAQRVYETLSETMREIVDQEDDNGS